GVTWRIMYEQSPDQGAINALGRVFSDAVSPPGVLSSALPSTPALQAVRGSLVLKSFVSPGAVARLGLTAIPPDQVPQSAEQAVQPAPKPGGVVGVVWRDFKPGGGKPGVVEKGELGLPGVTVQLRDAAGKTVQSSKTNDDGTFDFEKVPPGRYHPAIGAQTFAKPFGGYAWLGPSLINGALM